MNNINTFRWQIPSGEAFHRIIFFCFSLLLYNQHFIIKMSSTQLLFLDSDHANQIGTTPSDLIFNLNFNVANDMSGYAMAIQSISIPNMVYPINSNNNKIYWKEDGGAVITSTLTENNYSGMEMATELQTQLNADTGIARVYTVTYDSQSKKLNINTGILPNTIEFVDGNNNAYAELGFNSSAGSANQYTGAYPVYLSGTQYIDIQADITTNNYSSNGKTNILERIPLTANFGSIITYQNASDDYIDLNEDSINTLEIRVLDDKGNLWQLPQNAQISIVCKLKQFL